MWNEAGGWWRLAPIVLVGLLLASGMATAAGEGELGEVRWSGTVTLDGPFVLKPNETLVVEPGTTVRSADGAAAHIVVRGRIASLGTVEEPVRFHVNVSLHGTPAEPSRLENTTFAGIPGTALSVAGGHSVAVRGSTFGENKRGLHVGMPNEYAPSWTVIVEDTVFRNNGLGGTSEGAGLWLGGGLNATGGSPVNPDRLAFHRLQFEENGVAVSVGGDVRLVRLHNATFTNNGVGLRTWSATVSLLTPSFDGNDIQVDAGAGGANVRVAGTSLHPDRIRAEAPSVIQADTVALQESPDLPWWFVVSAALAAGFVVLFAVSKLVATRAPWLVLRDKIDPEDLLENEVRRGIFNALQEEPGMYLRELGSEVAPYGTVQYHIKRLEKGGLVSRQEDGHLHRFYPVGTPKDLRHGTSLPERIVALVEERPGIAQSEVTEKLDSYHQLVHHHVEKLEDEGRLRVERTGKLNYLYPASADS